MKRTFLFVALLILCKNLFAQTDAHFSKADLARELKPLQANIKILQSDNKKLRTELKHFGEQLSAAKIQIDSLCAKVSNNANTINQTANQLGTQIEKNENTTNKRIDAVDESISKKSLYVIIGILIAVLISITVYSLLNKRQKLDKLHIIDQLNKTKSSIEENLIKEFGKQTELIETQLQFIEKQKTSTQPNSEPDHSLALKVASEITLIERNLSLMDSNVKGHKQLKKSVEKLKDNLNANGYEIVELIGKAYRPGLPVSIVNSNPDETLTKDQEVISKILIPAVRYNDKIIQSAQVEVNVGLN